MTHSSELKDKIWSIADQLSANGINPTNKAVLAELGSGSYSSISPILKEWREKKNTFDLNDIPIELVRTVKQVWEKVSELSAANYVELSKSLETEVINLTVELELEKQKCIMQSKQLIELNNVIDELNKFKKQYELERETANKKHADETKELGELIELHKKQTVEEKILSTEYKTKLNSTEDSLVQANGQLKSVQNTLDNEIKLKYEAEKQTELKQIELGAAITLIESKDDQISVLSKNEQALKDSLSIKDDQVEKQQALIADLNKTVLGTQKEIDNIKTEVNESTGRVTSLTEKVNELTIENKSLTTENNDIQVQYDNLLVVCNSLFDVDVIKQFAINNKVKKEVLLALSNQKENKINK
ncbi:DNA-binding protein [Aliivibrio fischeri]|uniref:DNA-binding protein n=1 Tax=Aliivibrio fischeri TaxID=668 RepID=UPI0012D8AE82|nr:DNA-binding protein [Aliivibrio fischeri]MUJ20467.1 hypothetical protein [Aliivibrio fischeri]